MDHRTELAMRDMVSNVRQIEKHALVLASAPQVKSTVEDLDKNNEALQGSSRATIELFRAFMSAYPEYLQVRLITTNGMESIRLNRRGEQVELVVDSALQNKSDRPYFKEAVGLDQGEFYLSDFDLNQEYGELSIPYLKTMRVATPVRSSAVEAGPMVLVLNVDAAQWFRRVGQYKGSKDSLYVVDQQGAFLLHPEDSLTFADRKYGPAHGLSELDSSIIKYSRHTGDSLSEFTVGLNARLIYSRSQAVSGSSMNSISIASVVSKNALFAEARKEIRTTLLILILGLAIGIVVLGWLSEQIVRPIRVLANNVRSFSPGGHIPSTGSNRNDEVGVLASRFSQLAEKVNEQLTHLNTAKEQAEKAADEKDVFLSNFSHELRTPLNSISGMVEVLGRRQQSKDDMPVIQTLKYSVDHLKAMISDVLDYNRILEGDLQLAKVRVVPEEMARNICLGYMLKARSKDVALSYKVHQDVPEAIVTDKVRLTQIVHNLLSNALKFTDNGKVGLQVGWNNGSLVIEVEDTGVGMDPLELEHIFDRYSQTRTGKAEGSGIGLGLSIVKHLVGLLGGRIEVASEEGRGTRFTIELPVEIAGSDDEGFQGEIHLGDLKVLYVDDVEVNRITMAHVLDLTGVEVDSVSCCKDALSLLAEKAFDVVLMDLRMPEIDGFECIERIQELELEIPIIAVSADLGDTEKDKLAAMGVDRMIEKPVDPSLLIERILEVTSSGKGDVYTRLLNNYCQHDRGLLQNIHTTFSELVAECKREILLTNAEDMDPRSVQDLLRDIRHKLMPSAKMFEMEEVFDPSPRSGKGEVKDLLGALDELTYFLEDFRKKHF